MDLAPADYARSAQLVDQYANFPLGTTDATVIALTERLEVRKVDTRDRRHVAAVRPAHVPRFRLLPN